MALKPDAKIWTIREQILDDPALGDLSLQFETLSPTRFRLIVRSASLPYGDREIIFDETGAEAAAGTWLGSTCRPSWLRQVD